MDKLAKCGVPLRKAIAMGKADKAYGGGKKSAPKPKAMPKPKSSKGGY